VSAKTTTIVLVEDDARTAAAVKMLMARAAGHDVRLAATAAAGERLVRELGPDLVVVDLGLPDRDGVDLIRALRRHVPGSPILVLTSATQPQRILQALRAGARSYLFKDDIAAKLETAVDELLAGGAPLSSGAARAVLDELDLESRDLAPVLSRQEVRVLELVAIGFGYDEIAREMGVSINTVRTHVRSLYGKLGVVTGAEAVNLGWRLGLLRRPRPPSP
jgi:DNA-binding NarL/FixJ family response regulator